MSLSMDPSPSSPKLTTTTIADTATTSVTHEPAEYAIPAPATENLATTEADDEEREDGEIHDSSDDDLLADRDDGSEFEIETEQHSTPPVDDESVQLNQGCGIPCRFYNHDRCMRGADCGYLHGPDDKSIRDNNAKNVCLYLLLGNCKFGATKCAYSHRRDWLPPGWWDSEEGVREELQRIDDAKKSAKDARRATVAAEKEARVQRKREQQHLNNLLNSLTNGVTAEQPGPSHPMSNGDHAAHHVQPANNINGAAPRRRNNNNANANSNGQPRKQPQRPTEPRPPLPAPQPGMFPAQFHAPMQPSMSLQELAERMQHLHLLQRERQAQQHAQQIAQHHGFTERQVLDLAAYGIKPWDEGALTTLNMLYHY
ncbi:hypothetical protein BKA62DRAFT_105582 [Auriculariales sp. MPI-PUGE-AT-0066]|nr:hypothetical protein BKA62DRAFT_105582 [Auriculariales sp. MPI-PUGE-AT-0066]